MSDHAKVTCFDFWKGEQRDSRDHLMQKNSPSNEDILVHVFQKLSSTPFGVITLSNGVSFATDVVLEALRKRVSLSSLKSLLF